MNHCPHCAPPACEEERIANQKRREQRDTLARLAGIAFRAWRDHAPSDVLARAMHELEASRHF